MRKDTEFDPTAKDIPKDIIKEYNREALEKVLEGQPFLILGEFQPEISENADLSFESETDDMDELKKQFREWLKEKGLYPANLGVTHTEKPEGYSNIAGPWHRDGLGSEDDEKVPTEAEEKAGERLQIFWANKNQTELRVHADKTLIPTKPRQVVAINNRLVEHRRPGSTEANRTLITSISVVLIK